VRGRTLLLPPNNMPLFGMHSHIHIKVSDRLSL
jgi:hypothetical protein